MAITIALENSGTAIIPNVDSNQIIRSTTATCLSGLGSKSIIHIIRRNINISHKFILNLPKIIIGNLRAAIGP